jgi:hypothetical protein
MKSYHVCFATQYLLIYCLGGQKSLREDAMHHEEVHGSPEPRIVQGAIYIQG